ncbi:MAG: hypothetical protein F4Y01_06365 [Gammaproteobacteria bacterium]|nr:hypothetical protein [Gammaproteobacteria bacterium]
MPSIAFLLPFGGRSANDNRERLPRAFGEAGWTVACIDHESLTLDGRRLTGVDPDCGRLDLAGRDRYFVLGFGAAATFLDRMQMLRALPQERFVNTPEALLRQHGKVTLYLDHPDIPQPESHVSNDPSTLAALIESGGEWIGKPPAGSFGRDVYLLRAGDANVGAILGHLTQDGRYALLQRRIPMERGERRVLLAGGQVMGAYGKAPSDHRGNLHAGATPMPATLEPDELALAQRLAGRLLHQGVGFAAIDMAWPYVLEINLANPGWLETYERLTGEDVSPAVAQALATDS